MAVDERRRHALYVRLERVLGAAEARTLMEHLPPLGWGDVATKRDLDLLEQRVLATVRAEIGTQIHAQTRTMIFAMTGYLLSVAAIAFTAARLI